MHVTAQLAGDERRQHRLALLGLLVGMALGGMTLLRVAGPPQVPAELPSLATLTGALNGSYVSLAVVAYIATTAAWVLWGWLALSIALRLLVAGAEIVAQGAAWVRALRLISDQVTLPIVRRLIDGAVVTVLVVNIVARAAPAQAASLSESAVVMRSADDGGSAASPVSPGHNFSSRTVQYTVQAGDTLWSISERFYGTGFEFDRLVKANAGTRMPDGSRFTRTGVIQQGWTIDVPLPSRAIEEVNGRTYYVVEDEDTLRGVAARLLGDEAAWEQIFEANRDAAALPDGHTLTGPDLIWPGLRLVIPRGSTDSSLVVSPPGPAPAEEGPSIPLPPPAPPSVAAPTAETVSPTPEVIAPPAVAVAQPTEPAPTVTSVPIEVPVVVTPIATDTEVSTAAPSAALEAQPAPASSAEGGTRLGLAAAGLAMLATAGGALLLALRRLPRRIAAPLIPGVPEEGPDSNEGFAEAELSRVLEHRIHGAEVEPAIIVADQAARFYAEHGLDQIDIVTVGQRRSAISLTIDAGLAVQPRLIELAPTLGERLGGTGEACRTTDHDVLVRTSGYKLAGLTTSTTVDRSTAAAMLLPIGMLPGRETLYANWRELGHVLIAGLPGGGVEVVLTSLISALAARRRPDKVQLVTIASRRTLPSPIFGLPHQGGRAIDPTDVEGVRDTLRELRTELDRRMQLITDDAESVADQHEIVVIIGELADIQDSENTFELLGVHGASHGICLLAGSVRPEAIGDELLAHFPTRIALQTLDEDASIRLVGRGDAADLGGGGDLLMRIDGRVPLRARGFRLSLEHLDQLVKVMREAYVESDRDPAVKGDLLDLADSDDGQRPSDKGLDEGEPKSAAPMSPAGADDPGGDCQSPEIVPASTASVAALTTPGRLNGVHAEPTQHIPPGADADGPQDPGPAPESALPIRVRCFGTFRVTSGDDELSASGSDGAHYKAWDILAFLCAQPGESVSRERLVAAMWPDVDSAKAGNRLKVSLTRLRRMLKKQVPNLSGEVVRVERSGICRLSPELVSSDVHRFMALRRSASRLSPTDAVAALEEARSLYRGDLLTEPYYEWVHTRADDGLTLREQYREEYYRVTQRLAELHRQQGQPARAVSLYRDILKLEPTLEEVARHLYRCYGELGDRGALVREHRRLRDAIRHMMSSPDDPEDDPELYEPENETTALYEEILTELEERAAVGRSA